MEKRVLASNIMLVIYDLGFLFVFQRAAMEHIGPLLLMHVVIC